MSASRKIPPAYNYSTPTRFSILLSIFGLGSYKSKSPQESKELVAAANEDVKRSQAVLAESQRINEEALQVLERGRNSLSKK